MEILKTKIAITGSELTGIPNSEIEDLTSSARHCLKTPKRIRICKT